jgi:uncharacterized RDD family membrane protein YckC
MAFCAKCGKELPPGATFCPSCGAPVAGGEAAPPTGALSGFETLTKDQKAQEYWVQRVVAFIVDAAIVYLVLLVIFLAVSFPLFFSGAFFGTGLVGAGFFFGGLFTVLWGLIFVLYFAVAESTSGASIGKKIFKLTVVSKSGSHPNFVEAFIRNVSKLYWLLLLLDVVVGLALSHGYQQKYSDSMMGTKVVHT